MAAERRGQERQAAGEQGTGGMHRILIVAYVFGSARIPSGIMVATEKDTRRADNDSAAD